MQQAKIQRLIYLVAVMHTTPDDTTQNKAIIAQADTELKALKAELDAEGEKVVTSS